MTGASGQDGRRRLHCGLLLLFTIPCGLAWRFAPLHLPPFAHKYGGSALWASGVYWLVAMVAPRPTPARLGGVAAAIALAVELLKRVRQPALDAFRATFAGKVLLGRHFTVGAIAAYWIAIAITAAVDFRLGPGRDGSAPV